MNKSRRLLRLPLATSVAALLGVHAASAATLTWIDTNADNTWSTTAPNWLPGPTGWIQSSDAVFGGIGETVTLGEAITANSLTFNSDGYIIDGNTLTILGGTTAANVTVTTAGQTATISSTLGGSNALYKGGAGTLSLAGTSSFTGLTTVNAGTLSVAAAGVISGTSGIQINTGATFTNNGNVTITGGGALDNASSPVALAVRVGATFNQAGGTLSLASFGASNITNITGGTMSVTGGFYVGEQTNGPGTINQSGGTLNLTGGASTIRLGHWSNANSGTYNLTGGVLDASTAVSDFNIGWDGRGTMTVGGGAGTATFRARQIRLDQGAANGYVDTLTVSANGLVEVGSGGVSSAEATDVVILNGGTMKAVASSTWASNTTTNASTTSTIDANGQVITFNGNTAGTGTINLPATTGSLNFAPTGTQTIAAPFSGSTPLNKTNTGTTVLSGTSPYTGPLTLSAGTLNIAGSYGSAPLTTAAGVTLTGKGTIGSITTGGAFNLLLTPSVAGTLTSTGAFTPGADVASIVISGTVPLTSIPVLNYASTTATSANFALANAASYRAPVFTVGATATTLALGNKALTWAGPSGASWDVGTTASFLDASNAPSTFYFGDVVTFNDTPGANQSVPLGATVQPGNLTFANSLYAYTVTASTGKIIAGPTPLLKTGTGLLTLAGNVANTFSGGTTISQGAINVQNAGSLGTGTITLGDSGTGTATTGLYLDTNRSSVALPVVISANGTGTATLGSRATVTGSGANALFSNITLQRDVTFDSNAADRTDYQNITGTGNITITGTGRTIFITTSTFTGNITVSPGTGSNATFQSGTASGASNYIPDTASLTVIDNPANTLAEYRLSSTTESINGLSGNGTIDTNSVVGTLTVGANGGGGTFSGVLQNGSATYPLALGKAGTGTEVLTGVNTYTGATTITAGTLEIGGAGQLGAGSYAGAITDTGTLLFSGTAAQTLSGVISSTGALNKTGSSTLTLTGVNTYTGNTSVTGGTLVIGGAGQLGAGTYAGSITLGTGAVLQHNSTAAQTLSGVLSGAGGLSKTSAGTLLLSGANTYTGPNTVTAGTVQVGATAGSTTATLGTGTASISAGGTVVFYRSNTYTVPNSFSGAGGLTFNGINAGSGTTANGVSEYILTGTNTAFSGTLTATNGRVALDTPVDVGSAALVVGANGTIFVSAGTYSNSLTLTGNGYGESAGQLGALRLTAGTLNGPITLAGNTRITTYGGTGNSFLTGGIGGGAFGVEFGGIGTGANATTLTLAGTSTYTGATGIGSASFPATVNLTGALGATAVTVYPGSSLNGGGSIGGSLTFAAGATNLGVNAALSSPLTVAGAVTASGTAGQVTVTVTPGARQVAGTPLTVLTYGSTNATPASFSLSGSAGYRSATFSVTSASGPGSVLLDLGTKALTYTGIGGSTWNLNTTANFIDASAAASTFFNGDQVTFNDTPGANQTVTLAGTLQPASVTVNNSAYTYTLTASTGNVIAGGAALLKTGANLLTMAGNVANTYTGGTTLSQGAINVQNAGSLGTGTVTLGDANTGANNIGLYLDTNRSIVTNPIVISSNGTGTATLGSRSTITTSGANNTFSNITLQRDVVLDSNAFDRTDYTGISGTGNITVTGISRTIFSAPNTFTGNLTINLGSSANATFQSGVVSGAVNYIPDTTNVTIIDTPGNAQAEFRLSSTAEGINGLNGNGTIDTNSVTGTLTVGVANGGGTFSGVIQNGAVANPISIAKAGTGTQVLSGASPYTGATTAGGGVLSVSGSLTGTTALVVNNGGTLLLSGATQSINDAATLSVTGGTFKLGGTAQSETLSSLTLNANSVIDFGGTNGSATSGNSLIFSSFTAAGTGLTVQHWTGSLFPGGTDDGTATQDRLLFTSAPTEAAANLLSFYDDSGTTLLGMGHVIAFTGAGAAYEIVPIPEPSVLYSGLLAVGLIGLRERRRLRKLLRRAV